MCCFFTILALSCFVCSSSLFMSGGSSAARIRVCVRWFVRDWDNLLLVSSCGVAGQILLFRLPVARPPTHNASCFCCVSSMVTPLSQHADRCATTEQCVSDLRQTLGHLGKLVGACGRLAFDVDSLIIYWSLWLWRSILFNLSFFFSLLPSVFLSAVYTRGCQSGDRTPDGGSEEKHCRGELSFPPAASCG